MAATNPAMMDVMTNSIFIIAHAPLASALRQCVLHVFPDDVSAVVAFDVQPDSPPEVTLTEAAQALNHLAAAPTLVLADLFGATPCNVAQKLVAGRSATLIAGVNLPMLLRAVSYRRESLDTMAARAMAGGTQGVMQVAVSVPQNQAKEINDQIEYPHHQ